MTAVSDYPNVQFDRRVAGKAYSLGCNACGYTIWTGQEYDVGRPRINGARVTVRQHVVCPAAQCPDHNWEHFGPPFGAVLRRCKSCGEQEMLRDPITGSPFVQNPAFAPQTQAAGEPRPSAPRKAAHVDKVFIGLVVFICGAVALAAVLALMAGAH